MTRTAIVRPDLARPIRPAKALMPPGPRGCRSFFCPLAGPATAPRTRGHEHPELV